MQHVFVIGDLWSRKNGKQTKNWSLKQIEKNEKIRGKAYAKNSQWKRLLQNENHSIIKCML